MYGQLSYDMEVSLSCSSPACRIQPVKRHQRHAPFFETKLLFVQFTLCFICSTRLAHRDIWQDKISMSIFELPTLPREKLMTVIPDGQMHEVPRVSRLQTQTTFAFVSRQQLQFLGHQNNGPWKPGSPTKKWRISCNKSGCNAGGMFLVWNWLSSNKNVTLLVNFRTFNFYFSFGIPFRHLLWVENRNLGTGTVYTA